MLLFERLLATNGPPNPQLYDICRKRTRSWSWVIRTLKSPHWDIGSLANGWALVYYMKPGKENTLLLYLCNWIARHPSIDMDSSDLTTLMIAMVSSSFVERTVRLCTDMRDYSWDSLHQTWIQVISPLSPRSGRRTRS